MGGQAALALDSPNRDGQQGGTSPRGTALGTSQALGPDSLHLPQFGGPAYFCSRMLGGSCDAPRGPAQPPPPHPQPQLHPRPTHSTSSLAQGEPRHGIPFMDLPPGCPRPLSPSPTSHLRIIGHLGGANACGTLQGPRVNRTVFTPHSHHNQLTGPAFSCSEHARLTPFRAGLCPRELRLSF